MRIATPATITGRHVTRLDTRPMASGTRPTGIATRRERGAAAVAAAAAGGIRHIAVV